MIRSYHREYTSSRPITEVKHGWAPPVPGTEMAQEAGVPNRFACKHYFCLDSILHIPLFSEPLLSESNLLVLAVPKPG